MPWDLDLRLSQMVRDETMATFSGKKMMPTQALWRLLLLLEENQAYLINPISGYPPKKEIPPLASALTKCVANGVSDASGNQTSR